MPGQHRERERGEAAADQHGEHEIAAAAPARAIACARVVLLDASGQPAQAEQEQHDGDDFHRDLRERQIGRREPGVGDALHEADDAEQGERDQAVELGLDRGTDGAGPGEDPQQHEFGRGRHPCAVAPLERHAQCRAERGGAGDHEHAEELRLQSAGAGPAQQPSRRGGEQRRAALEQAFAVKAMDSRGAPQAALLEAGSEQRIDGDAADQRDEAHRQRRRPAVPDGKAVGGQRADHGPCGRGEHRPDRPRRHDADDDAGEHQQLDRHAHPEHRLVRLARQVARRRSEEHVVAEAKRVDDGEKAGQRGRDRQAVLEPRLAADEDGLGEEHLLGKEAVQQRHPGHRGAGHHGERAGDRHGAEEAVEAAHVAGSGLVVDDADRHEERGLERRVVHHVEDTRDRRQRAVQAEQQRDEAEVADGRVGEQALQVVLEHRRVGAEQQGDESGAADQPEPHFGPGQHRPQPCQEKHACLHQRGRMQIRRHRRRRHHRVRQPEVERELRALRQRTEQHQRQHRRVQGVAAHALAGLQHGIELVAADDVAEHQHAGQQRESARRGEGEGHARATAGVAAVVPVADQQQREQARQLPEQHDLQQVSRDDHAEHRAHEREQERVEARGRVLRREVVARIHDHQQPHAGDEHREHPGEAVEAHHQVEPEARQPCQSLGEHGAVAHLGKEQGERHRDDERDQRCPDRFKIARPGRQKCCDHAAGEGQQQQQQE